jgi:hypothetical protein
MAIIVTVPLLLTAKNQQLYKGYFFFQFPHTLILLTIMCRILKDGENWSSTSNPSVNTDNT